MVRIQRKYLSKNIGKTLDFGFGTGENLIFLAKEGHEIYGLEGSKQAVKIVNKKIYNTNIKSKIKLLHFNNYKKLPFKKDFFDNIICFEVLEHTFNYNNLVKEMHRVLKIDGTLYLSVPFAAKFHFIPWDFFRYTPTSLKMIMENNNFEIVNFQRRGADFCVVFHYITVAILGMIFEKKPIKFIFGIILLPLAIFSAIFANISEYFDWGAPENTLGFFLVCKKL